MKVPGRESVKELKEKSLKTHMDFCQNVLQRLKLQRTILILATRSYKVVIEVSLEKSIAICPLNWLWPRLLFFFLAKDKTLIIYINVYSNVKWGCYLQILKWHYLRNWVLSSSSELVECKVPETLRIIKLQNTYIKDQWNLQSF